MQHAQYYYWVIIVAFSLGFFLKSRMANKASGYYQSMKPFTIPEIIRTDTFPKLSPKEVKYLRGYYPSFLGKFAFGDTLYNDDRWREKSESDFMYSKRDSLEHYASDGLQLIPRPDIQLPDLLYERNEADAFFPVFIPNETGETKLLFGKDNYVYGIQEARDSTGEWRPIEHRGSDWCGVGRWELKVHPKEYAVMLMPLYKGNYATELRIIFKNGENRIISKPYRGTISYEQFYFKSDSWMRKWFKQSPLRMTNAKCYGSYPIEYAEFGGK